MVWLRCIILDKLFHVMFVDDIGFVFYLSFVLLVVACHTYNSTEA
jgi:hypothetical protein